MIRKRNQPLASSPEVRGTAFAAAVSFIADGSPDPSPDPDSLTERATFQASQQTYPLKDSFILGSGSDTHICNSLARLVNYRPSDQKEVIFTGNGQLEILGFGEVLVRLEDGLFQLINVAYIPTFDTNIVSLDCLINNGYNWNPTTGAVFKGVETIFRTRRIHRQHVIEFNEIQARSVASTALAGPAETPAMTLNSRT